MSHPRHCPRYHRDKVRVAVTTYASDRRAERSMLVQRPVKITETLFCTVCNHEWDESRPEKR